MQIKAVIRYLNGNRIMHDTSVFTLLDVLGGCDGRTPIILCVEDSSGTIRYLNISKLIEIQPVGYNDVTSWSKLQTYLSTLSIVLINKIEVPVVVPATLLVKRNGNLYSVINPYPSTQNHHIQVYSGDNDSHISLGYGSVFLPHTRNNPVFEHMLTDVVIETTYSKGKLNLDNTLPVINGVVCYPERMADGSLYARNGVYFCKNRRSFGTNSVLIDFSELGSLKCYKLSDCSKVSVIGLETSITHPSDIYHGNMLDQNDKTESYVGTDQDAEVYRRDDLTIIFDLPEGVKGIPVVVLFGRLITSCTGRLSYYERAGRIRVTCSISKRTVNNILVTNLEKQGKGIFNTPFYRNYFRENVERIFEIPKTCDHERYMNSAGEIHYVNPEDGMNEEILNSLDPSYCFVGVITTDKKFDISFLKPTYPINGESLWFSQRPFGGILMNPKTLEIIDYTSLDFYNGTLITFFNQTPLYKILNDNIKEDLDDLYYSTEIPKHLKDTLIEPIRDNKEYCLIDFYYEIEGEQVNDPYTGETSGTDSPEESQVHTETTVVDSPADEIIKGNTVLLQGDQIQLQVTRISNDLVQVTYGTEDFCGVYERSDSFSAFVDNVWYFRKPGSTRIGFESSSTYYRLYNKDHIWYIAKEENDPIIQSSDNNGILMPWDKNHLKWYRVIAEVVDTTGSTRPDLTKVKIAYIDASKISVTSNYPGLSGDYLLESGTTTFDSRVWTNGENRVFYDATNCCWKVAIGSKIIYQSATCLPSSSPWHAITYTYLGE